MRLSKLFQAFQGIYLIIAKKAILVKEVKSYFILPAQALG